MKNFCIAMLLLGGTLSCSRVQPAEYPSTRISNKYVEMKLYLPDPDIGYYRATRFDWSGIIYSLEYKGHQYFGEWKKTHDPFFHEDLTGPVEAYINPGLGYSEAEIGGEFIRIGVGAVKKTDEEYIWNKTYEILDHGQWKVEHRKDWIQFRHVLDRESGWRYTYTKRIELMDDEPGFSIIHTLKNRGTKTIETDQFNHNFFVMDQEMTGPGFQVEFPFPISSEQDTSDLVKLEQNKLMFTEKLEGTVWMVLTGYGPAIADHQFSLINTNTHAGVLVNVNKPLHRVVFWASSTTLCPENSVYIQLAPGEEETWVSEYRLFTEK
jgi:hypothetical protein